MASSPDAPSPSAHFSESDIVLLVGKDNFPFRVHKALLLNSGSKFFVACLNNFAEAETNTITLPEDTRLAIRTFVEWLYSGKITPVQFAEAIREIFSKVLKFADKACAEGYCNDLMDAMRQHCKSENEYFLPLVLDSLLECGLRHSQFYRFLLKNFVYEMMTEAKSCVESDDFNNSLQYLYENKEMTEDVMAEILRYNRTPYTDPSYSEGCCFHDHKESTVCSAAEE